jgi:hypothetical protein
MRRKLKRINPKSFERPLDEGVIRVSEPWCIYNLWLRPRYYHKVFLTIINYNLGIVLEA